MGRSAAVARSSRWGGAAAGWGGTVAVATTMAARVRCDSNDNRYRQCAIDGRGARLVRQYSKSPCVEGRTWGVGRGFVWVNDGCRAEFASGVLTAAVAAGAAATAAATAAAGTARHRRSTAVPTIVASVAATSPSAATRALVRQASKARLHRRPELGLGPRRHLGEQRLPRRFQRHADRRHRTPFRRGGRGTAALRDRPLNCAA